MLLDIQWKLFVVCLLTVFVLILLSFVEPGYHQICADKKYPRPEDCTSYNAIAYFFIRTFAVLNEISPAVGAIATAGIGVFTWTLWKTSQDQGKLTEIAIRDARIASQRELRAYVSVVPDKGFIKGGEFCLIVKVENTGNTPAFDTRCLWSLKVGEPPSGDVEFKFTNPNNDPIPTFVLYPGGTNNCVLGVKISSAEWANIKVGKSVIRAFGVVEYRDAFNDPQIGTFNCFMDWPGYEMFHFNYQSQPDEAMRPVPAPFKFAETGNRASFG